VLPRCQHPAYNIGFNLTPVRSMMQILVALALLTLSPTLVEGVYGADSRGRAFLSTVHSMRPEVVAHVLAKVEQQWKEQVVAFYACTAQEGNETAACNTAPKAFQKSCFTVMTSAVQASSGDKDAVGEYFNDVCHESELRGWRQDRCTTLSTMLTRAMTRDSYDNRETLDVMSICKNFWTDFSLKEKARMDEEQAAREAAEKKAEEDRIEEENLAAENAAKEAAAEEQRKKAEEEARLAAEQERAKEEALKAQEREAEAREMIEKARETQAKLNQTSATTNTSTTQQQNMTIKVALSNQTLTSMPVSSEKQPAAQLNTSSMVNVSMRLNVSATSNSSTTKANSTGK